MSKKVIKSSNKNEKYNLKSVLDTDNIMSGVSLKAVTAIGCASVIASCGNDKPKDDGKKDENKLKWEDFKDYQAKFKNGKEDFEKFVSECKKQGISEDKIKEMIENLEEPEVQNVLDGKIKKENGEIKIDGKVINKGKPTSETNDTFSNFDNLSEKQKETLTTYGITDQNTLNEFLNIKDNEGFKNKKISELFNEKDIKDETLRTKLEAYKNSKQQPTPQVSEEKVKKLKELMQHNDDNYTIYNFYDNNIKTAEIDKIYEQIKDKTLTEEDKDVSKNNSLAKKLKDIIEDKNNIKTVQLAIFKKIVDELKKDKEFFEFSSDKKSLKIKINFKLKDKDNKDQTVSITKEYKPDDIDITKKLDIEDHQIYKDFSSLKEIKKSSINEIFTLPNAKDKDGKDIANGAGETSDLNAYLVVLKKNFDEAIALNITIDDVKNKIYDQLLKNIQAKLLDFVDQKLKQTDKVFNIDDSAIVAAMKSTGICKDDNDVIDEASMKKNPIDNKFFLSAIIGTGGFMNSDYKTMITAMFKHFHDKYDNDNVGDFKKKIDELKSTDFTDNDADTKLKINNGKSTYFEKKTASAPSGWDKFANVINKIHAIGEVSMDDDPDNNKLNNNSKTIADATKIDHINKAFKAIHDVRAELDKITDPILKGSKLYEFLEDIVGKWKTDFKITYEKSAAATYDYDLSSEKYLSDGLLPIAVMAKKDHHDFNDIANLLGNGKILGDNAGTSVTGSFQLSLLRIVFTYMSDKSLHDGANTFDLHDGKNNNGAAAANQISLATDANNGTIANYYFTTELKRIQGVINGKSTNPAKVQAFVDVVKAMNIPEKIKWNGAGNTIKVEPSIDGGANNNKFSADNTMINKQNIAYGDLGKYIIPILGISENSPHLIIGLLSINGNLRAIDNATDITYNGQYAYDVTNNRACLKQAANDATTVALLTKKNTDNNDKKLYSVGVCKNQ